MSCSPDHSTAAGASLYCSKDTGDVTSWSADGWISQHAPMWSLSAHSSPPDESTFSTFIKSEPHHMPQPDYLRRCRDRSIDFTAPQDSINWILKVHAYYRFSPVTAFLSVNHLDRFLSSRALPQAIRWPFQLLSVACLSLAAKMEEPQVPLLLDLQFFETKLVFEARTVQRIEPWVMNILN